MKHAHQLDLEKRADAQIACVHMGARFREMARLVGFTSARAMLEAEIRRSALELSQNGTDMEGYVL